MQWSIQELARSAGATSRTLRHYDDIGLLKPSRVGANGYRYYDQHALVQLQRILLLRELGLGLRAIADVLEGERNTSSALRTHLQLLEQERDRIGRQIQSVRTTLHKIEDGEEIMANEAFDGFDHTQYKDEVIERWGQDAYQRGDLWWRSLSADDKKAFQQTLQQIASDFAQAHAAGESPDSDAVQAITQRHHQWLAAGTQGKSITVEYFTGLGQLYVDDPRYAANYENQGAGSAEFVRDAMKTYAERNL